MQTYFWQMINTETKILEFQFIAVQYNKFEMFLPLLLALMIILVIPEGLLIIIHIGEPIMQLRFNLEMNWG